MVLASMWTPESTKLILIKPGIKTGSAPTHNNDVGLSQHFLPII